MQVMAVALCGTQTVLVLIKNHLKSQNSLALKMIAFPPLRNHQVMSIQAVEMALLESIA